MAQITAKVYDATGTTLIATLSQRRNPNWLHQLNDTGSGSVQIHVLDSDLAAHPTITNYYNIVRLQIGGTDVFAFIVENPDLPPVPADEHAGLWWTLSGRGVLALLDDAIVYPELAGSSPTYRTFGWMAIAYDDSGWTSAIEIQRQDAGTPITAYANAPEGWVDHLAYWIWSQAATAGLMPPGTSYFRKTFTLADATLATVHVTCDNAFQLWIDDELIIDNLSADASRSGWNQTQQANIDLGAGSHTIAVQGVNETLASGYSGPAALLLSILERDPSGTLTGTVLTRTDSTWSALDYPASPPGMPIGQILGTLVTEAQARGALTGITLGFTDTADYNSASFTVTPLEAFQVGTSVLDAAKVLIEQFIDLEMTPTLELRAYNKGTLGSDLTGSISLLRGTHFEELTGQSSGHLTNAILARTQLGQLTERTDATSLGSRKRKETYVEVGTAPNIEQAQNVADAVFPDFAYPVIQLIGKVTEASGPYTSYKPGDTIKLPNKANVATATDLLSLAVEEDEAANLIYHIEASQADS